MPTQPERAEGGATAPKQYMIHNASRSIHNRTKRAAGASHKGLKQHVLDSQRRLVRGRPLVIGEEELKRHLPELKDKVAKGLIEVKTPDGRLVDLDTLEAGPVKATPPLPRPVPDSVANDQQGVGEERGVFPDGPVIPHGGMPKEASDVAAPEPTAADFAESVPSELPTVEEPAIKAAKKGGKHK